MKVTAIHTSRVTAGKQQLFELVVEHLPVLEEESVLVISSKIVALCEGRTAPADIDKIELIRREADMHLDRSFSGTGYTFTIKHRTLSGAAGIDQSNTDQGYVLWPADPQDSINKLWGQLRSYFNIEKFGLIMCDSTSFPMRRGTIGVAIAHCGLHALTNYIGKPDLYERSITVSQRGVVSGLSAAANVVMGEGNEQTPMAIISDVDFVEFQDRPPTQAELDEYYLTIDNDLYAPFLENAPWQTDD